MKDFKIMYPNDFDEREKPLYDAWKIECDALSSRGPIDMEKLLKGELPKNMAIYGTALPTTGSMLDYYAAKYAPDEPLFTDDEYAKAAGYKGRIAMPAYGIHDETYMIPVPRAARDKMLVSQLNHEVTQLAPIYEGDTLFLVPEHRHFTDLTPENGSEYRTIAIYSEGSVYNQNGEKVTHCIFRVCEGSRIYEEGKKSSDDINWDYVDWCSREPIKYTDEDWDKIIGIWKNEYRRGKDVLFWEDVKIGEEPAPTCDGPVEDTLEPIYNWGMGLGGNRTLKHEIMNPETRAKMKRSPYDGIYRLEKRSDAYVRYPAWADTIYEECPDFHEFDKYIAEHTGMSDPFQRNVSFKDNDDPMSPIPKRFMNINFIGRDYAVRHFMNWIGDSGWLKTLRWGIMPPEAMMNFGRDVPRNPEAVDFMAPLPDRRGKCLHHPVELDAYIIKSKVVGKRIEGEEHLVDLCWWIETVRGEVTEEGQAVVVLPSREKQ